jgi:hypothetical protein
MEGFGSSVPEDGHLYVIVGGTTFSAGMYSAAFAKHSGGDRVVLVGEPVGDTLRHWGEDNLLRLGMHDFSQPCRDWRRCHWDALFLDLAIDDLTPDLEAPLSYQDFANQVDPAMIAIAGHQERLAAE